MKQSMNIMKCQNVIKRKQIKMDEKNLSASAFL